MSSRPKPTAETLWPVVAGVTTFSDLCRLLYGRGVMDLPLVERIAIADALATRLGFEVTGCTLRGSMKPSRWRSRA